MKLIDKYIQSLMDESTPDRPIWNIEKIRQGKKSSWDYIDGCMILALLEFYKETKEEKYFDFAKEYVNYRVGDDGFVNGYGIEDYNLDNINGAKNLLTLYELTNDRKYMLAANRVFEQVEKQPRNQYGNFWHKDIYPNQVWLDGLYMVMPFYVRYANLFMNAEDKAKAYDDVYSQFFNVEKFMKNEETGLYYHCFDSTKTMYWCDPDTGLSKHYWLRSLGWFSMAMLDCLTSLEDRNSENYEHLCTMFKKYTESILKVQSESGMWYQLPEFPGREKNYLETSGSSIFAYSILKGVRLGFLPEDFAAYGEKAFKDICDKYLVERDGKMGLGGICLVAGLGGKTRRDGSYEYYMSEPIVEDDAKGTAPFILAYLEMKLRGEV